MFRYLITIISLLLGISVAHADEAGRIVFVTGQAHVGDRPIVLGDAIQEGDALATGADGYVYLKTVDNGFLILRPGSKVRVVAYHVDAAHPSNTRVKFELLNGVARSISGQAVKQARQNFRFNTPVAAIGVRGTDFTVFTDQQTSRIAVISGGVVVSGFSSTCSPNGGGPCEGSASRELFAAQAGQLLQIQKGQPVPQLLRGAGGGLSPDSASPPRSDEPTSKAATGNPIVAATDVSLDAKKNSDLLSSGQLQLPPVMETPKPSEILWGRWESVANLPADSDALAKLKSGGYGPASIVGSFFISRVNNTELVMPQSGSVGFNLANSEAYIRNVDQSTVAASVQNARLNVDFSAQTFNTSMDVVASGIKVGVSAQGDVTPNGELFSDIVHSNATVRGYLGGANAKEAGYVFSTNNGSGPSAFGATRWTR